MQPGEGSDLAAFDVTALEGQAPPSSTAGSESHGPSPRHRLRVTQDTLKSCWWAVLFQ